MKTMQQIMFIGSSQTTWNMKPSPFLSYTEKDGTWGDSLRIRLIYTNYLTKLFLKKSRRIYGILAFLSPMISKRDSSECKYFK